MTGLPSLLWYAAVVYLTARTAGGPVDRGLASARGAVRGRDPGADRRVDCGANVICVLAWLRLTSAGEFGKLTSASPHPASELPPRTGGEPEHGPLAVLGVTY